MTELEQARPESGVELMRSRLWQAALDLASGQITATEANRITKEAGRELRQIEAALRVAKLRRRLEVESGKL